MTRADERGGAVAGCVVGRRDSHGAQSSVVGVALLLGATVVAVGVLTASVGALVDGHAARADARRVAADLDDALRPVETTGHRTGTVRFADGGLHTVEREVRVFEGYGLGRRRVATVRVGGLVYDRGERRVRSVAGAVTRGRGEAAWTTAPPPIFGSEANGVLVVGVAKLNASGGAIGGSDVTARISTNVTHDRRTLGTGRYAVAVETAVPAAFEAALRDRGASSVERRDFDGDGVPSVLAAFPGTRRAYVVVHDMRLEVSDG
ncbi:MAG: type IV pilin [Haloarculaceae archaeon]